MKTSHTLKETPAWRKAISLLALPAIAAYMLGYRVQGVRCTYRLGNFNVTPLEPVTPRQYWLMRLIPNAAAILVIILMIAIGYALGASLK